MPSKHTGGIPRAMPAKVPGGTFGRIIKSIFGRMPSEIFEGILEKLQEKLLGEILN